MKKELLHKYLNNQCTNDEFKEFVDWALSDSFSKDCKQWCMDDWFSSNLEINKTDKEKLSALLDKIHHEINLRFKDSNKRKQTLWQISQKWFTRIACVLFIPLLFLLSYYRVHSTDHLYLSQQGCLDTVEIQAPSHSRATVHLSDGTVVYLNYGSTIKYPRFFSKGSRPVELSGEAYFKVAHKPKQAFIVESKGIHVVALGTSFNVNAYPDQDILSATLVHGKLELRRAIAEGFAFETMEVKPNQHVSINLNTGEQTSSQGNIQKYIAWKDGKLLFEETNITVMAQTLGRMYNTDIEVDDEIKELTYTATFIDDPLFLILDLMKDVSPIDYKVYPRKQLGDGSFSKQRVRIFKKKGG